MIELSPIRFCSHNWDMLPLKCSEDPISVKIAPSQSESMCTMMMATLNDTAWKMDRTNDPLIISTGIFFCGWTQFTSSAFPVPGAQDAMSHTSLALIASLLLVLCLLPYYFSPFCIKHRETGQRSSTDLLLLAVCYISALHLPSACVHHLWESFPCPCFMLQILFSLVVASLSLRLVAPLLLWSYIKFNVSTRHFTHS